MILGRQIKIIKVLNHLINLIDCYRLFLINYNRIFSI